ncbi:hypothetical protein LCGC14_0600830 [marine sediment metagenome]|uniref:Uncharacterized protein n=1 Tax=marine sediment metagenome TaxID=412755 RepID=A0A0F9RUL0_9ZZZZ
MKHRKRVPMANDLECKRQIFRRTLNGQLATVPMDSHMRIHEPRTSNPEKRAAFMINEARKVAGQLHERVWIGSIDGSLVINTRAQMSHIRKTHPHVKFQEVRPSYETHQTTAN